MSRMPFMSRRRKGHVTGAWLTYIDGRVGEWLEVTLELTLSQLVRHSLNIVLYLATLARFKAQVRVQTGHLFLKVTDLGLEFGDLKIVTSITCKKTNQPEPPEQRLWAGNCAIVNAEYQMFRISYEHFLQKNPCCLRLSILFATFGTRNRNKNNGYIETCFVYKPCTPVHDEALAAFLNNLYR